MVSSLLAKAAALASAANSTLSPIYQVTSSQWAAFNSSVSGRLGAGRPIDLPCYLNYNGTQNHADLAVCNKTQLYKGNSQFIADHFGGYENANWGACQATGQSCYLSSTLPVDPLSGLGTCYQGSVSNYYVEVHEVSDVQKTLAFAQQHGLPLVIKNSGHDYKGRSAAPNSLAIWTHNYVPDLKLTSDFIPDGCSAPVGEVVTMGAGQGFGPLYDFANANNVTVVGGSSSTVGPSGGWITGGGHSALSNTLGLGVDNVQQLRAVLPNGTYVTANRCQNSDIFFALRGGGGSTFGVVMEMTTLVHPVKPLQYAEFIFASLDPTEVKEFISITVENANKWASEGWGGYLLPSFDTSALNVMVMMTPNLNLTEAQESMKPVTDFAIGKNLTRLDLNLPLVSGVVTIPSFYEFVGGNGAGGTLNNGQGTGSVLSSRLVPSTYFEPANQEATKNALYGILEAAGPTTDPTTPLFICITAPSTYQLPVTDLPGGPGHAAVTPAWRTSPWHVIHTREWDPADPSVGGAGSVNNIFAAAHNAMNPLRAMTPDGGAYQNEADSFEPDPVSAYWGQENYNRLLALKHELDPQNLLTCHQCIGWDKTDSRYSCYPQDPNTSS